jgi:SnoaL-like polyketide cyclase
MQRPRAHHIEDQIAEGDKVVTRIRVAGTHEDDLPGISKTGNKLETTATVTHRTENGRLAEKWSNKDELGLLQQLGVIPTPEAPRLLNVGGRPRLCAHEQLVQPARLQLALLDP